jgi:hypothetical protein
VRALRAWRAPATPQAPPASPTPGDDPYVERLERELRERT